MQSQLANRVIPPLPWPTKEITGKWSNTLPVPITVTQKVIRTIHEFIHVIIMYNTNYSPQQGLYTVVPF